MKQIIYADRVSTITGLTPRALRRRRQLGLEPISFRLGRRVAYYEADVTDWIEKQRAEGVRRMHGDADQRDEQRGDEFEEWVQRQLANAPELGAEQRELIRRALAQPAAQDSGGAA